MAEEVQSTSEANNTVSVVEVFKRPNQCHN